MILKGLTSEILTRFPKNRISFCSAFVRDANQPVEVLFCVDDSRKWHSENISMNPSHYSFMRFCGSSLLTQLQMYGGANVYCHPRVRLETGQIIEYETVSADDFCYDLNHWTELHLSGNLHKPFETIVAANSDEIAISIENNIQNVIRIALLLLPAKFSYEDLFLEIALCTYVGKHWRSSNEKNREDMRNMVKPKMQDYFRFYFPHLKQHFSHCVRLPDQNELNDGEIEQDKSKLMNRKHLHILPSAVLNDLVLTSGVENVTEKAINSYIRNQGDLEDLKRLLAHRVRRTVVEQEIKDLITAVIPNTMKRLYSSVTGRT